MIAAPARRGSADRPSEACEERDVGERDGCPRSPAPAGDFLWQPSLFEEGPGTSPERSTRPEYRRSIDATSWVDVIPGWLADADEVFHALLEVVPWEQRERWMFDRMVIEPRLTAEVRSLVEAPHPKLAEAAQRLTEAYGVRYDHLWLNFYRDGRDSTAWHRDRISCRRPGCTVPVLSLGATRRFLLRRKEGGRSIPFPVSSGTMLVMGGRAQDDWVHAVPKEAGVAGARISVNFQSSEQADPKGPGPRRRVIPR